MTSNREVAWFVMGGIVDRRRAMQLQSMFYSYHITIEVSMHRAPESMLASPSPDASTNARTCYTPL